MNTAFFTQTAILSTVALMKGIILAGGSGTRLYPVTLPVCKQLLPIYDKPMIYYPLSVLMLAGIKEVLLISTPKDIGRFEEALGNGSTLGIRIEYATQEKPRGLAEALIIGEKFVGDGPVCLILGDNIFYGHGLPEILISARKSVEKHGGAHVFGYYVTDPERFGVVEFDKNKNVVSIEEKPENPKSSYAALGLYFYDQEAATVARTIEPSARGEVEITAVNQDYLKNKKLKVSLLGRGFAWFDAGTHDSLLETSEFVMTIEKRTGLKVGCIEEIAYNMGYINRKQLLKLAEPLKKSGYGDYLQRIASDKVLNDR